MPDASFEVCAPNVHYDKNFDVEAAKLMLGEYCATARDMQGVTALRGFTVANVGERNAESVLKFLAAEKIRVTARDLLLDMPCRVYFFPKTGLTLVKKRLSAHNDTVVKRGSEYSSRLQQTKAGGEVELF
ncbi:MAG: hypothetical protein ACREUA_02185 [Burkholderiales bacterium]